MISYANQSKVRKFVKLKVAAAPLYELSAFSFQLVSRRVA